MAFLLARFMTHDSVAMSNVRACCLEVTPAEESSRAICCCLVEVAISDRLETRYPGLFVIGDGSGVTHSLSHASASGVFVAREIAEEA